MMMKQNTTRHGGNQQQTHKIEATQMTTQQLQNTGAAKEKQNRKQNDQIRRQPKYEPKHDNNNWRKELSSCKTK